MVEMSVFLRVVFLGKCNSRWRMFCKWGATSQGSSGVVGLVERSFSKIHRVSWWKWLFFEGDFLGKV